MRCGLYPQASTGSDDRRAVAVDGFVQPSIARRSSWPRAIDRRNRWHSSACFSAFATHALLNRILTLLQALPLPNPKRMLRHARAGARRRITRKRAGSLTAWRAQRASHPRQVRPSRRLLAWTGATSSRVIMQSATFAPDAPVRTRMGRTMTRGTRRRLRRQ